MWAVRAREAGESVLNNYWILGKEFWSSDKSRIKTLGNEPRTLRPAMFATLR